MSKTLLRSIINVSFTFLAACGQDASSATPRLEDVESPAPRNSNFEYYGWFLVDYSSPTADLIRVRAYTNTGFAVSPPQAQILRDLGFKHIVYVTASTDQAILDQLEAELRAPIPLTNNTKLYATGIPNYREKYFSLYRIKLVELKESLTSSLEAIDVFYLADEPALNRHVYPDQAFLDQKVTEFEHVFGDKKTMMVFAQYPEPRDPLVVWAGEHFAPPPALDIVGVDPYIFWNSEEIACDTNSIRRWLYETNPYSNINWAKQYRKPLIVIGDAQILDGKALDSCYPQATFDILKADRDVTGLIWYQYDKSYNEVSGWGAISGAANAPEFVRVIENLGKK